MLISDDTDVEVVKCVDEVDVETELPVEDVSE